MRRFSIAAATVLVLLGHAARAADRVVSLNLCTDQLLVLLAPEKIAALSFLARDPRLSFVAAQAQSFPTIRPSAEAVLRLRPGLVLATRWGAQSTLALLDAAGVAVLRLDLPQDFDAIAAATRALAARLDVAPRGEILIAAMRARLSAISASVRPLRVIAWEPRGYTAGPGTLMDAVIRAAGLDNVAAGGRVGLETLLRHPPDLLIVPEAADYPSLATDLLSHPAVRAIPRRAVPSALTICGAPFTALAAAMLAR